MLFIKRFDPIAIVVVLVTTIAIVLLQNLALAAYFPQLPRFVSDFSPAYLQREIASTAAAPGQTVFLGDSVLWGYRLSADQTMISILAARGCACRNFAFKNGGPPNDYALTRLLLAAQARPKAVVLEIDQKVFSQLDGGYQSLHPAVAMLADPLLTPADRALLTKSSPSGTAAQRAFDRIATSLSLMYAMRSDIRAVLYGEADTTVKTPLNADMLEGTYDLTPLSERNVSVHFLKETAQLLRAAGIPVIAFLTPTNHTLLHDYIDNPEYRANGLFLKRMLEQEGARVLDLDAAFPAQSFLDEVHLTAPAQMRLADFMSKELH